jgi:hypothetical protein
MSSLDSVARCVASDVLLARMTAVWALVCAVLTIYDLHLLAVILVQSATSSVPF